MKKDYIHLLPEWPDFTWNNAALLEPLASARFAQGCLLGRMAELGFALDKEAELAILTEETVRSAAIEGERLDDRQVRSSLARRLGIETGGIVPSTKHIDGLCELMFAATRDYNQPLTAQRLFGWHSALFPTGHNVFGRIIVGSWRKRGAEPMRVVSGPIGRESVHFEAPVAARIPTEMRKFLAWFNQPCATDPIIHAALAHFYFVTIHPFDDGNGRLARAITEMALARADRAARRFYSMSSQIEKERREYYAILEKCQSNNLDVTAWLLWFLGCLSRALISSGTVLETVIRKSRIMALLNALPANQRQVKAITKLLDGFDGPFTTAKYAKITKCSADTALRDINALIANGILERGSAGGRSTAYQLCCVTKKCHHELDW